MSAEIPPDDREMMDRIGKLAGQINRLKSQQAAQFEQATPSAQYSPSTTAAGLPQIHHPYPSGGWRGGFASRGGYGGHHARVATSKRAHLHRHRSLVLNNSLPAKPADSVGSPSVSSEPSSAPSYVIKNDRHLQLINSSLYHEQAPARTRAVEQSRIQRLAQKQAMRNHRERSKLMAHFNAMAQANGGGSGRVLADSAAARSLDQYEVNVQGIRFAVARNGSKLIRIPGDENSARATPKAAIVGGVKFYRSKSGNLYRHGIVKAQWQTGRVKKVNVPCKTFSMTGSCSKGPQCRFLHDPNKVAVCKDFLQQGKCASGDSCDLSHELTPERTPTCLHYVRDNCTKPNCKFIHADVSPTAPVCHSFGVYGYCAEGASCSNRHVFECPDFSNNGVCKTKGCKLLHRERASVLRKASQPADLASDGDEGDLMEDVSSDDEGGSENSAADLDSDEVDEFIGQDEDQPFTEPGDFIEV